MKRNDYVKMTKNLKSKPGLLKFCTLANKFGPWVYGVLYGLFVLSLVPLSPMAALRALLVPIGSYFLVQMVSMMLDYPRPYEKFNVKPALPPDKEGGHSIPCKQAYWYAMIGLVYTIMLVFPFRIIGIVLLIGAAGLSAIRVYGGLHFTRDVIIGVVLAIVFAFAGFMA